MASRRRLPKGWSHPLKPGEVAARLPGVGSVYWYGRPQDWKATTSRRVFLPETPQPGSTI